MAYLARHQGEGVARVLAELPLGGQGPGGLLARMPHVDAQAGVRGQVHDLVPRADQRAHGGGTAPTPAAPRLEQQDHQRRQKNQQDATRDAGDETPREGLCRGFHRIGVLVARRRRQLRGSLRGLRGLEHLRARHAPRLGDLGLRRVVARGRGIEDGPDTALELDLDPRADIGAVQSRGASLGAALGVGTHDDAGVHTQLMQHQGHECRVLLVVTDELIVAAQHALQAIRTHTRA